MSGTVWSKPWVNVLWLQLTDAGATTVNDLASVTDALSDAYASDLISLMGSNVTFSQAKSVWLPTAGTEVVYTGTYSHGGGANASIRDAAACVVLDWAISDYYRGGHPRTYLPGPEDSGLSSGFSLDTAYRSSIASGASTFKAAVDALTSTNITSTTLGTVRFQSKDAWLDPPVFRPYTSVGVRSIIGTQRRRLGK